MGCRDAAYSNVTSSKHDQMKGLQEQADERAKLSCIDYVC